VEAVGVRKKQTAGDIPISNSHPSSRVSSTHSRSKFISTSHLHSYFHSPDHEFDTLGLSPFSLSSCWADTSDSRMGQDTFTDSFLNSQRRFGSVCPFRLWLYG